LGHLAWSESRGSLSWAPNRQLNYRNVIHEGQEGAWRWGDVCVGRGIRDDLIIITTAMFTQVWTWCRLYWLQHQELAHLWSLRS